MTSRATNPTSSGSMLLDRSTAKPGSIDKAIFEKKSESGSSATASGSTAQGSINPNYLQECREDNPDPTQARGLSGATSISNCRFETPPDQLHTDQPFNVAAEFRSADGASATGRASFRLYCTFPKADGSVSCEDQSEVLTAEIRDGLAKASGTLFSPKKPVPIGTKLLYHVVAEHPGTTEKVESAKVEVEAAKPPQPLAVWSLGALHFGFDSSFILPSAAERVGEFQKHIEQHPGAAVAVFGHADPVGDDEYNQRLSGRRAQAVLYLLTKNADGWTELAKGTDGDTWGLRTTQTMLAHLHDPSGKPYYNGSVDGRNGPKTETAIKGFQNTSGLKADGIAGPLTLSKLHKSYMDDICTVSLKNDDFVGDPKDAKRQWACNGCGESNPVLVFSKSQEEAFAKSSDKSERNAKNAANRRATVMLFPESAKGPGKVRFPCPAQDEGATKCKAHYFPDGDARRNPSDRERTWEKDKDTFACKFYAGIAKESASDVIASASSGKAVFLEVQDSLFRTNSAVVLPEGNSPQSDRNGPEVPQALTSIGAFARTLRFVESNPGKSILVAGHTDTEGADDFNKALSSERAHCVHAALMGDRTSFANVCAHRNTVGDQKQILRWISIALADLDGEGPSFIDCDPGAIDDQASSCKSPTSAFQLAYNQHKSELGATDPDLVADGIFGPKTWGAVFDCYEWALLAELRASRDELATLREGLQFLSTTNPWVGFGESKPIDGSNRDDFRSQTNRRVEILFFDPGEEPDVSVLDRSPEQSELYDPERYERTPLKFAFPMDDDAASGFLFYLLDDKNRPMGADPDSPHLMERIAGAPYRIVFSKDDIRIGYADQRGLATEYDVPDSGECSIQWGRQPDPVFKEPPIDEWEADNYFIHSNTVSIRPS